MGVRLVVQEPATFLQWLEASRRRGYASFDDVDVAHVFAVAAVAALARRDGSSPLPCRSSLHDGQHSAVQRFAHAIGFDDVTDGHRENEPRERDRTVSLTRVKGRGPKEPIATSIVRLLLPAMSADDVEVRDLFKYVLVELLRNVGQHSNDPLGGIVAAQVNDAGPYADKPALQIVVVDNGIGIFEALRRMRPKLDTPEAALAAALEPHVSGAFPEGESGSSENAGLGLFFIAEMAKLTDGTLLVATRGASLLLDRSNENLTRIEMLNELEYPGTLVVFETALAHVHNYVGIMERIREVARERTPRRITQHWIKFEEPPVDAMRVLVAVAMEDTAAAAEFSEKTLQPLILKKRIIALDFKNLQVCTQSFLHALLHEAVRLAWAKKVPLFVMNVSPAVRVQLDLVENYSLGG
jgi:hypothetical protein